MKINEMIKEKRQELGLTQRYVAEYLGVSIQAVSKWEKGATYPDITLLPILARLLKIDLNTLFSFNETLTELEINQFVKELLGKLKAPQDYEAVFNLGMEKIQAYPSCELLARTVALVLESLLSIYEAKNRSVYQEKLNQIYDQLMTSANVEFRQETILMRVPSLIGEENYEKAEAMLNSLPDTALDKRVWQAEVYLKQERFAEAEKIYEEKLIDLVVDLNNVLWGLSLALIHQNQVENGEYFATFHETIMKLFGLQDYSILNAQLDIAMANKDVNKGMDLLTQMIHSVKAINDPSTHPFRLMVEKYTEKLEDDSALPSLIMNQLIHMIKNDAEFEVIRQHSEYKSLLEMVEEGT